MANVAVVHINTVLALSQLVHASNSSTKKQNSKH